MMSQLEGFQAGRFVFTGERISLLFYSDLQLIDEAIRGEQSALLNLLISVLNSSKNTLRKATRIKCDQLSGHPMP